MDHSEDVDRSGPPSSTDAATSASAVAAQQQQQQIDSLRQFLLERPKNAKAMSKLACLLASQSQRTDCPQQEALQYSQEAVELAHRATVMAPQKPFGYAALSIVAPEWDQRRAALEQAIERTTGQPQCTLARAVLLVRLLVEPRDQEARQVRAEGTLGNSTPNHPTKRNLDQVEESIYVTTTQTLDEAWTRESEWEPSQIIYLAQQEYRLGLFFRKKLPPKQNQARAVRHFTKACDKLPSTQSQFRLAQFWLATLSSNSNSNDENGTTATTLSKCPKDYIVGLYATFASRFDNLLLESLQYTTPTELRRLVDQIATKKGWAEKAVDLGCGTGLSGQSFRDCLAANGHFTGVDLSPQMLVQARQRQCYQQVMEGDCLQGLTRNADLDLITACDVFVYIGDLEEIFMAAYESLSGNGLFAFSTELWNRNSSSTSTSNNDYVLHECARFAHSKEYIQRLAGEAGFEICGQTVCPIRKNQGKDVTGSLVVLRKKRKDS